ncbi:Protein EXECUTER 2, chloroplastic, partial [Linum perenne]
SIFLFVNCICKLPVHIVVNIPFFFFLLVRFSFEPIHHYCSDTNTEMAGSNLWLVGGQPVATAPQLTPVCCLDSSLKKPTPANLGLVFGLGCHRLLHPSYSKLRSRKNLVNLRSCRCGGDGFNAEKRSSTDVCSSLYSSLDWDWNRWGRHFVEIEQAESFASVLKFQLEEAIEKEDFQEAAKLKNTIAEATSMDSVSEIMSELKNAIDEERYHDASRLCKHTGSGLVGWWVGYSTDSTDPFGRLVRITPGMGRFVAKSYTPRQLVNSSSGTPLFEIFVVKDADESYVMQVVWLRSKSSSATSTSKPVKTSMSEVESALEGNVKKNEVKQEETDEKGINIEGATEEGIKSVINFLKDKIPGLKVNVMNLNVTGEVAEDDDSMKQLIQDEDENTVSNDDSEDESEKLEEIQPDGVSLVGSSDSSEDGKDLDMKLFIGGVVHEDNPVKDDYSRVPAEIKDVEKDSFVLHIPRRFLDYDNSDSKPSKLKVAAIAAKGVTELMPPDVAKAFWGGDKLSSKVSRNVREIFKLAVSQAQKQSRLSENTNFSRISTTNNSLDPFDGLYVGAFGPYGTEVVQLKRKYGRWSNGKDSSDVEFFEYVEAVKLTGDLNVPAGQVTFRAKIGKGSRNPNRGMYPDELGVVASYKGEGRIANFGFKNPKWVEGELLQLNSKGIGPYVKGADLGFLYVVPEQSFLVLFNRLTLPE